MQLSLIGIYGLQMTVTLIIVLGLWSLKVMVSSTDLKLWFQANAVRVIIALILCWVIAAGLVVVPGIAVVLGGLGFAADQSAAGLALALAGFIIRKDGQSPDTVSDIKTGATSGE